MARMGFGPAMRTPGQVIADAAAAMTAQERLEAQRAAAGVDERNLIVTESLAAKRHDAELESERKHSSRLGRALSSANEAAGGFRRRSDSRRGPEYHGNIRW